MNDDASEVAESDETGDGADPTGDEGSAAGSRGEDAGGADAGVAGATAESLADRVAEYDAELAEEVRRLESSAAESADEVEDLQARLKRVQADFQNYKKRAKRKEREIRTRATEDFVERVVEVRDNLVRALDQDAEADIRPGVEATLETFDRILTDEGVDPIDPDPGETVDPMRHEVMMRVDSDHPDGTVVDVYRPGYQMGDKVVREAQVTVSTGEGAAGDGSAAVDATAGAGAGADADGRAEGDADGRSDSGAGTGSGSASGADGEADDPERGG